MIKDNEINISFEYPWFKPCIDLKYTSNRGFTRLDLFRCIYEGYKKIYEDHEVEINGENTGIMGCKLSDLVIDTITYNPKKKNLFMYIKF